MLPIVLTVITIASVCAAIVSPASPPTFAVSPRASSPVTTIPEQYASYADAYLASIHHNYTYASVIIAAHINSSAALSWDDEYQPINIPELGNAVLSFTESQLGHTKARIPDSHQGSNYIRGVPTPLSLPPVFWAVRGYQTTGCNDDDPSLVDWEGYAFWVPADECFVAFRTSMPSIKWIMNSISLGTANIDAWRTMPSGPWLVAIYRDSTPGCRSTVPVDYYTVGHTPCINTPNIGGYMFKLQSEVLNALTGGSCTGLETGCKLNLGRTPGAGVGTGPGLSEL